MPEPKQKKTNKGSIKNKFLSIYKSLPGGSNKSKVSYKEKKEINGNDFSVFFGLNKLESVDNADTDSEYTDFEHHMTESEGEESRDVIVDQESEDGEK